mgnify:CR=1 FL=1
MILRVSMLPVLFLGLFGCSDDAQNKNDVGSKFSHQSLTSEQFASLANIPEKAEQKREQAFTAFATRSSIADHLLKSDLKDDLNITRRLVDTKSRIVLDAYFDRYLSEAVTNEAVESYYSENSHLFSNKEYELAYYQIRKKSGTDESKLLLLADALYKDLMDEKVSVNIKKYSALASEKNIVLTSENGAPKILKALEGISEGGYTQPVVTKRGVQIFSVQSVKAKSVALEFVKPRIEYKLKQLLKEQEYKRLSAMAMQ